MVKINWKIKYEEILNEWKITIWIVFLALVGGLLAGFLWGTTL